MSDKNAIREKLKIKRRFFEYYRREMADLAILENFLAAFSVYDSFCIYNSISSEASTKAIISALSEMDKRIYLPRVEKDIMVAAPLGEMKKGAFGIKEPTAKAYCGEIEVTVIPLLAVNSKGNRIGYGKGYYDRYLKDKHTLKVGLGYSFQIEEFEADEWDIPLDAFVCEKGIYYYESDK